MLVAPVALAAIGALGCSSDNNAPATQSQIGARNMAAAASCDRAAACSDIGPGKTYETRDQCSVKQTNAWDTIWPPRTCDGHFDTSQLDVCLASIRASECGNALDLANVLLNKCPSSKVCDK